MEAFTGGSGGAMQILEDYVGLPKRIGRVQHGRRAVVHHSAQLQMVPEPWRFHGYIAANV